MVFGYALSFKTTMLMEQNNMELPSQISSYLEEIPRELAVVGRKYPDLDLDFRTWGNKFAIQHRGKKLLYIEPFQKTHLIGFNEFYHQKEVSFFFEI